MARVIPGGAPDYTAQIAAREAASNDALTRLFYTLMARREEHMRNEQLRRELLQQQQSFTASENQLNRDWRTELESNKQTPQQQPSHLAPGMGGRRMAPAAPAAPAPRVGSGAPTSGFTPTPGQFGPRTDRFSALAPGVSSYASELPDESAGETVTLSGQSVQTPPSLPTPRRANTPVGTTPQPRQSRRPRMTAQGVWGPIDTAITKTWDALEKKYDLPRGILQTHVGITNNFGRDDGGADGWFRMSPDLRAAYQVRDEDVNDIHKMSAVAAQNIHRNREAYNRYVQQYNAKNKTNLPLLGNNASDVPAYAVLSQFGVVNGPRMLVSALVNGNAPLAPQMAPEKGVDASRVLVTKGLPATATGNDLFGSDRGIGKRAADVHATTIQHQENPPDAGDGQSPPRPPRSVPDAGDVRVNERGAHGYRRGNIQVEPWLVDTVKQASRTLPPGYRVDIISTVDARRRGTPWHPTGRAIDIQIYDADGRAVPNIGGPNRPGYAIYENMAAAAKAYQMQNYPGKTFTWGGHFNSGVPYDRMHFQSQGRSARNFTPQQLKQGAEAIRIALAGPQQQQPAPATVDGSPTEPPVVAADAGVRTPMYGAKPITQPKTVAASMFGAKASPPLATMVTGPDGRPTVVGALAGMRLAPRMQMAEESPVQIPNDTTRTVVPKTAAIPAESTAAANQPTPQTAQTVVQPTQTAPVPTQGQVNNDSVGYTADDADERSATRLSPGQDIPIPRPKPPISMGGPSRSLRDLPESVTNPPPTEYQDPAAPFTSAVPGSETAEPMDVVRGIGGGIGGVASDIGWAAGDVIDRFGRGARDLRALDPLKDAGVAAGEIGGDIVKGAGYLANDIRKYDPMSDVVKGAGDLVGDVWSGLTKNLPTPETEATPAPHDEGNPPPPPLSSITMPEYTPSYAIPPQVQRLMEQQAAQQAPPPVSSTSPLPVEASKVADAIYDVSGIYGSAMSTLPTITVPDMSNLLAGLFPITGTINIGKSGGEAAKAKPTAEGKQNMPPPVRVPVREVLPSGEELYPTQPEQRVPPKNKGAAPLNMPTVQGVTNAPATGAKTMPSAIPPRGKYAPDKKYSLDPNTRKSVIDKQEPIENIAPGEVDEEE